jgi:hypothetical protein
VLTRENAGGTRPSSDIYLDIDEGLGPMPPLVHILRRLISDAYLNRHHYRRPDRLGHAEVINHRPGTGWSSGRQVIAVRHGGDDTGWGGNRQRTF